MPFFKVVKVNQVKRLKDYSKPSVVMPSYIGMLDISTTNNTLAKVKAIYGADTNWIQHSGYVLRGATSGVVANSATKTGGSDDAVVISHTHSIPQLSGTAASNGAHDHGVYGANSSGGNVYAVSSTGNTGTTSGTFPIGATGSAGAHTHSITTNSSTTGQTGSAGTGKNLPNYKNVYIWERTA